MIVFPGTWSDRDCFYVLGDVLGQRVEYIWHGETDLSGFDCVVLPGGFSYGDYLRPGAIARFSAIMAEVARFAQQGGLVFGICNGFQILCEAGLLPGALIMNSHLQYRCQWVHLRVENGSLPFTSRCRQGQVVQIPVSHDEGSSVADGAPLAGLEAEGRVAFRYCDEGGGITAKANPNGSLQNIAGVVNREGNVLGMMPHPERAGEELLGGTDGNLLWESIIEAGALRLSKR